eukprot:CAMPEP_0171325476 /NCGR_PEP_ID=MMETSP0816-20121228/116831_1 /TAXON_ID=420281 /ORGANISM="Proboscia inermis, Strain CCAP1064/1" /LENGTH=172 /DNA_ID=CAMNT_0011824657 /DNA_START=293 /DNA_END=809 /DNA_ORIENTATION=-
MDVEQEEAKNVCEEAGGKIFLYDLDVSYDLLVLSFYLDVVQFPVCIDKDCGIDGVAAIQEKATSDESLIPEGAVIVVTPSCIEDPDAKFLFKTKTKKNGQLKPSKEHAVGFLLMERKKEGREFVCPQIPSKLSNLHVIHALKVVASLSAISQFCDSAERISSHLRLFRKLPQ